MFLKTVGVALSLSSLIHGPEVRRVEKTVSVTRPAATNCNCGCGRQRCRCDGVCGLKLVTRTKTRQRGHAATSPTPLIE